MKAALMVLAASMSIGLTASPPQLAVTGHWEGEVQDAGRRIPVSLSILRADDGLYLGRIEFRDPPFIAVPFRLDRLAIEGRAVRLFFDTAGGRFEGTLDADEAELKGAWIDGTGRAPLTLRRGSPAAGKASPLDVPLDIGVPTVPQPFVGGGQRHLAYELHITNLGHTDVRIQRLEVVAGDKTLAAYAGPELNELLSWPARPAADARTLAPWQFTVAWIWISQPRAAVFPADIRHRLTVDGRTLVTAPLTLSQDAVPAIGPPLRGGPWVALNGPGRDSAHRLSMMTVGGRLRIPQRFGIDWVRVSGDRNASYGADVLAVADGTIAHVTDGVPDNAESKPPAVEIDLDNVGGNVVVLDIGGGRYVFYAHLQPGLPVKAGERVRRGQVLGRIGNSGDSGGAHLHFHVMDAPLHGEGVPFAFDSFEAVGGPSPGRRVNVSPMNGAQVRFPD